MLPLVLVCSLCGVLGDPLQAFVSASAEYYNVSLSVAATLASGKIVSAAAGRENRAAGTAMTTESLIPSGSVTKTFTAVAVMRYVEQGKLGLEMPAHQIVDPWLKAQGMAILREQWGGDATIEQVTIHHLLQMRSGVRDYDDAATRAWTLAHPKEDILPSKYVTDVDKRFLFAPGSGGAYSGIGYVLLGWVLCAATEGCHTWADLDQKSLVLTPSSSSLLRATTFMRAGSCAQYPGVVHQYCYNPVHTLVGPSREPPQDLSAGLGDSTLLDTLPISRREAELKARYTSGAGSAPLPHHCTVHQTGPGGSWYPYVELTGPTVGERNLTSGGAEGCCGLSDSVPGAAFWSFIPNTGSSGGGTCRLLPYQEGVKPTRSKKATSGRADPKLSLADFTDLYGDSCLNGWTMGNIASTPTEVTQFYHQLFAAGTVVNAASLQQMMTFQKLTTGFAPGTPYGLGLMGGELKIPLKGLHKCGQLPACECELVWCAFKATTVGHAGLDYGSGMPVIGFIRELNISYAMASNVGENVMGMNSTLGVVENSYFLYAAYCRFFDIVVHAQLPSYPAFKCE